MVQLFLLAASAIAAWGSQPNLSEAWRGSDPQSSAPLTFEDEWAEESAAWMSESGGLRARVDFGRAPGQSALRVTLEGAQPHGGACLQIGTLSGEGLASCASQAVLCDAQGRASVEVKEPLPFGLGLRFVARPAGGATRIMPALGLPNGPILPITAPQRGDVVITEIMKDPTFVSDAHGEWFEIENVSNHLVNIAGWKITDQGTNSHTILNGVQAILLSPGQRFVLGNDVDPLTNGGVNVNYKYSNFTLGNGADSIILTSRSGFLVDEVDYDDGIFWPDLPGKTLSLDPASLGAASNDDPANWCVGQTMMAGGNTDMGTPNLLNDVCP